MEDLVKALLSTHEDYSDTDSLDNFALSVWNKFCKTISEYKSSEAAKNWQEIIEV